MAVSPGNRENSDGQRDPSLRHARPISRATTAARSVPVLDAGNNSPHLAPVFGAPASGQRAQAHPHSKRSTRSRDAETRQEGCAMKPWLNVAEEAEYAGLSRTRSTRRASAELRHARVGGRRSNSAKARMDRCLAGTTRARRAGTATCRAWAARCSVERDSEPKEGGTNDGSTQICKHKGRARDRLRACMVAASAASASSLSKWTNREISSEAEADEALDELTDSNQGWYVRRARS